MTDLRQLWTMTASDLRQRIRDRSVIIFALVVPLALMFVFDLVFGGAQTTELEPVTVAASAPADDELAGALLGTVGDFEGLDVTLETVADEAAVRAAVEEGDAGLGLVVPEGFSGAVAGRTGPEVVIVNGGAGLEAGVVVALVDGVLADMAAGADTAAAGGALGVPPAQLGSLARAAAEDAPAVGMRVGEASEEQLSAGGAVVAGQAGLFLLFTVGFGVLGLLNEREQGTLARLQSLPMRRWTIVAAKGLVSFILGAVATAVLLAAGGAFFDVGFGSVPAVAVLVLSVSAAATSLMFIIARVARTAEQANIAQSILALVLGVAGGAFFPVSGSGLGAALLDLNPVAAFTRGLGITSGGGGLADVGGPVLIMVGFAVVCLGLSRLVPGRGVAS